MKFKYTGHLDEITIRGVTFKRDKAVDVDDDLTCAKLENLDYFAKSAGRPAAKKKAKSNDGD